MPKRWIAELTYVRPQGRTETQKHEIEELEEIQDLVEGGENYYALERVVITHNPANLEAMGFDPRPVLQPSPGITN